MADAYFEIEEYLWFDETIQGNVNVGGLVYDDLLEDFLGLGPEEVLTVYSDVIEETLNFADDPRYVGGLHHAAVTDNIDLQVRFGVPLRVRQSVLNLIMTTPVTPTVIANVHLDVLHGVDVYWEEVSSELQCHSSYANAVPYYWEWLYESLEINTTDPQPLPSLYVVLMLLSTDIVNMRHDVIQEYYFNSKCFEEFFVWDEITWGWDKYIAESLVSTDTMQEIIGKVADEYLLMKDSPEPKILVLHTIDDRVFIFDAGTHEKYYLLTAADTLTSTDTVQEVFGYVCSEYLVILDESGSALIRYFSVEDELHAEEEPYLPGSYTLISEDDFGVIDASVSERYYLLLAESALGIEDGVASIFSVDMVIADNLHSSSAAAQMGILGAIATESMAFADLSSFIHGLTIEESLGIVDIHLERWTMNVLIECGFNMADIIS